MIVTKWESLHSSFEVKCESLMCVPPSVSLLGEFIMYEAQVAVGVFYLRSGAMGRYALYGELSIQNTVSAR
jgi:hypothetical protein